MAKFSRVIEQVRRNYVDEDKVTYDQLVDSALAGMLANLDPHSEYMNTKKHQALMDDTRQEFGGIGIVVSIRDDWLTIISPMEGTPGARAGLRPGDRIVRIGDQSTKGMGINDAVNLMRGKVNTEVTINIAREDEEKDLEITLKRERIKTKSVRDLNSKGDYPLLEDGVGYVRLGGFSENTATELEAALTKMEEAGLKGLVLDLRDNPGGLLTQSARVAEKFIKAGQLIVSTEGRDGRELDRLVATVIGHRTLPMVILINGGSASASEIVAGCLQDLKRAELIGTRTFGKGSVQSILPLKDGSALRLTTAKYYTPSHRTIHEKGIEPDYVVEMTPEQMRDIMLQRSPGGLETLPEEDRERVKAATDSQLDKALEILREKL
jgi:carboxyl-terminal processing protease